MARSSAGWSVSRCTPAGCSWRDLGPRVAHSVSGPSGFDGNSRTRAIVPLKAIVSSRATPMIQRHAGLLPDFRSSRVMVRCRLGLVSAALLLAVSHACADILIGQTAGFSGPVGAGVKEATDGAKLYLDHVNAEGGVNGEHIVLLSMDDKFEPALAAENARE